MPPFTPLDLGRLAELAQKLQTPGSVDLIRAIETAGAQLARLVAADLGAASGACRCTDGHFLVLFRETAPGQLIPAPLAIASPSSLWESAPDRREAAPAAPADVTFHRTIFEVEVLSRDPLPATTLSNLADVAQKHGASVELRAVGPERLSPLDFAVAIREHGSAPAAFGVDDYGSPAA